MTNEDLTDLDQLTTEEENIGKNKDWLKENNLKSEGSESLEGKECGSRPEEQPQTGPGWRSVRELALVCLCGESCSAY